MGGSGKGEEGGSGKGEEGVGKERREWGEGEEGGSGREGEERREERINKQVQKYTIYIILSTHSAHLHWHQESVQLRACEVHWVSQVERGNCEGGGEDRGDETEMYKWRMRDNMK